MFMSEIIEMYPQLGEVLTMDYGFHCIGCMASELENLEQGAAVHGMNPKEIKEMIKTLNEIIAESN
ncbi:DUF1858 domain-containing protein [Candidatus Shapirobacteria bacterium]|nr:DUF1858 domain-containing protein [Candidatus Shapirobacteria bacterium]